MISDIFVHMLLVCDVCGCVASIGSLKCADNVVIFNSSDTILIAYHALEVGPESRHLHPVKWKQSTIPFHLLAICMFQLMASSEM